MSLLRTNTLEVDLIDWIGAASWHEGMGCEYGLRLDLQDEGFKPQVRESEEDGAYLIIGLHENAQEQAIQLHDITEVLKAWSVSWYVYRDSNGIPVEVQL